MEVPILVDRSPWREDDGLDAGAEAALVERARHDRRAFGVLYRRHYSRIGHYLYRRTGDVHATEDLLSEVFLAALRGLPRYRPRGVPFAFWLYGIATNLVNRWARRTRRHEPLEAAAATEDPESEVAPRAERDDERESVLRGLLALKPKHQTVIALHYLEGLSVEEIALVLGCRAGTVKSRLSRARDHLRAVLQARR